jgi:hypothetical protein
VLETGREIVNFTVIFLSTNISYKMLTRSTLLTRHVRPCVDSAEFIHMFSGLSGPLSIRSLFQIRVTLDR